MANRYASQNHSVKRYFSKLERSHFKEEADKCSSDFKISRTREEACFTNDGEKISEPDETEKKG